LKKERPKRVDARICIAANPAALVMMLDITKPARYSGIFMGDAKIFNKLRDQTSLKNAVVTPCMTRMKKSHKSTAPNRAGTKSIPEEATELRQRVMNPHRMISTDTHTESGRTRVGLPRSK
jgi:hypothetical protein